MKSNEKKKGAALLAAAAVLVTSTPAQGSVVFEDALPPYDQAIHHLVERGVAKGIQEGTFGTPLAIKRVDAAILLARALQLPEASQQSTLFTDVPARAIEAIGALEERGIVVGKTAGRFDSETTITRGEVALLLSRAFDLTEGEAHSFTDVSPRYDEAVRLLVHHGITKGVTPERFETERPVTRGEYALFLYRALHLDSPLYKQRVNDRLKEERALDEAAYTTDSWKQFLRVLDQLERESAMRDVWTAADATDVLAQIDVAHDQLERRSTGGGGGGGGGSTTTVRTPILEQPLQPLQLKGPARLGDQPLEGVWIDPRTSRVVKGTFRWVQPDEQVKTSGAYEWIFEPNEKRYRVVKGQLTIVVTSEVDPEPTPSVDRTVLEQLIQHVDSLEASRYTVASYRSLEERVNESRSLVNDHTATQSMIDSEVQRLQRAIEALVPYTVDLRPLDRLVKEAMALRFDDYTPVTARALERAMTEAKETLGTIDVDQQRVDASYAALTHALGQLIFSNEPLLHAMIATATTTLSTVNDETKRDMLQRAIDEGAFTLQDASRTKALIEERIHALEHALKETEAPEALQWTGLIEQMERAAAYEGNVYPESLDVPFRQAILQAKRALQASEQSVIDEAERALREATDALERHMKEKEDDEKREQQIRDVERALERLHSFETDERPTEEVVRDYAILATSDLGIDISVQSNEYPTFTIVVTKGEARGEKTITVRQRATEQPSKDELRDVIRQLDRARGKAPLSSWAEAIQRTLDAAHAVNENDEATESSIREAMAQMNDWLRLQEEAVSVGNVLVEMDDAWSGAKEEWEALVERVNTWPESAHKRQTLDRLHALEPKVEPSDEERVDHSLSLIESVYWLDERVTQEAVTKRIQDDLGEAVTVVVERETSPFTVLVSSGNVTKSKEGVEAYERASAEMRERLRRAIDAIDAHEKKEQWQDETYDAGNALLAKEWAKADDVARVLDVLERRLQEAEDESSIAKQLDDWLQALDSTYIEGKEPDEHDALAYVRTVIPEPVDVVITKRKDAFLVQVTVEGRTGEKMIRIERQATTEEIETLKTYMERGGRDDETLQLGRAALAPDVPLYEPVREATEALKRAWETIEERELLQRAKRAVEQAEQTRTQASVDEARLIVQQLSDERDRTPLLDRLHTIEQELLSQEGAAHLLEEAATRIKSVYWLDEAPTADALRRVLLQDDVLQKVDVRVEAAGDTYVVTVQNGSGVRQMTDVHAYERASDEDYGALQRALDAIASRNESSLLQDDRFVKGRTLASTNPEKKATIRQATTDLVDWLRALDEKDQQETSVYLETLVERLQPYTTTDEPTDETVQTEVERLLEPFEGTVDVRWKKTANDTYSYDVTLHLKNVEQTKSLDVTYVASEAFQRTIRSFGERLQPNLSKVTGDLRVDYNELLVQTTDLIGKDFSAERRVLYSDAQTLHDQWASFEQRINEQLAIGEEALRQAQKAVERAQTERTFEAKEEAIRLVGQLPEGTERDLLEKALDALVLKQRLEREVERANVETEAVKGALGTTYTDAVRLLADVDATQEEVDRATEALRQALDALLPMTDEQRDELQRLIERAETLATYETDQRLTDALSTGKSLMQAARPKLLDAAQAISTLEDTIQRVEERRIDEWLKTVQPFDTTRPLIEADVRKQLPDVPPHMKVTIVLEDEPSLLVAVGETEGTHRLTVTYLATAEQKQQLKECMDRLARWSDETASKWVEDGQLLLNDARATEKAVIDATNNMTEWLKTLQRNELQKAIDRANGIDRQDVTDETARQLTEAVRAGNEAIETNASYEQLIDRAEAIQRSIDRAIDEQKQAQDDREQRAKDQETLKKWLDQVVSYETTTLPTVESVQDQWKTSAEEAGIVFQVTVQKGDTFLVKGTKGQVTDSKEMTVRHVATKEKRQELAQALERVQHAKPSTTETTEQLTEAVSRGKHAATDRGHQLVEEAIAALNDVWKMIETERADEEAVKRAIEEVDDLMIDAPATDEAVQTYWQQRLQEVDVRVNKGEDGSYEVTVSKGSATATRSIVVTERATRAQKEALQQQVTRWPSLKERATEKENDRVTPLLTEADILQRKTDVASADVQRTTTELRQVLDEVERAIEKREQATREADQRAVEEAFASVASFDTSEQPTEKLVLEKVSEPSFPITWHVQPETQNGDVTTWTVELQKGEATAAKSITVRRVATEEMKATLQQSIDRAHLFTPFLNMEKEVQMLEETQRKALEQALYTEVENANVRVAETIKTFIDRACLKKKQLIETIESIQQTNNYVTKYTESSRNRLKQALDTLKGISLEGEVTAPIVSQLIASYETSEHTKEQLELTPPLQAKDATKETELNLAVTSQKGELPPKQTSGGVLSISLGALELGLLSSSQLESIKKSGRSHELTIAPNTIADVTGHITPVGLLGLRGFKAHIFKKEGDDYRWVRDQSAFGMSLLLIPIPAKFHFGTFEEGEYLIAYEDALGLSLASADVFAIDSIETYDYSTIADDATVRGNLMHELIDSTEPSEEIVIETINGQPFREAIAGTYGTLRVQEDRTYTYAPEAIRQNIGGVETFDIEFVDRRNDTKATATLTIRLTSDTIEWNEDGTPRILSIQPRTNSLKTPNVVTNASYHPVTFSHVKDVKKLQPDRSMIISVKEGETIRVTGHSSRVLESVTLQLKNRLTNEIIEEETWDRWGKSESKTWTSAPLATGDYMIELSTPSTSGTVTLNEIVASHTEPQVVEQRQTIQGTLIDADDFLGKPVEGVRSTQLFVEGYAPFLKGDGKVGKYAHDANGFVMFDEKGQPFEKPKESGSAEDYYFIPGAKSYHQVLEGETVIGGEYGALVVNKMNDGTYTYTYELYKRWDPKKSLPAVETFTYRAVHPSGHTKEETLTIAIGGTGADAAAGPLHVSFENDPDPSVVTFSQSTGESYRIHSRVAPRQAASTIPLKS
ncbi:hypothetical protein GOP80_08640 [Planococcaceae bacterium Storch 2/2-2]|nr:hypothetical protein [Planococcaceae bacterium Storch 2/2-2]